MSIPSSKEAIELIKDKWIDIPDSIPPSIDEKINVDEIENLCSNKKNNFDEKFYIC